MKEHTSTTASSTASDANAAITTKKMRRTTVKKWIAGGAVALTAALSSSAARADQPVYIIAHRCNDIGNVPAVVEKQGVNAIEADFSYGAPFWGLEKRWVVDHDYAASWSTNLDDWLADVATAINAPGSTLSLIVVDIKDSDGDLPLLYKKIRDALGPDINLIFSINDYDKRFELLTIKDALNADLRAGADISYLEEDEAETQFLVKDFFESEGFERYWYDDGLTAALVLPNSVIQNIDDGIALRDAGDVCESFHGVQTWTYEQKSTITYFLDKGVNGILVNAGECYGFANLVTHWQPHEAVDYAKNLSGRFYATPQDNPFEHDGASSNPQCVGVDLELARSQFLVNYDAGGVSSPAVEIPIPASPPAGDFAFNTPQDPFVLPCDVETFGGQIRTNLLTAPVPVFWQLTTRFLLEDDSVIVSHGHSGMQTFDEVVVQVSQSLSPGDGAYAGYMPVSSVNPWSEWMYQPSELPPNTPVRMELVVAPFEDAGFTQAIPDNEPSNDVVNLWVERVCTP